MLNIFNKNVNKKENFNEIENKTTTPKKNNLIKTQKTIDNDSSLIKLSLDVNSRKSSNEKNDNYLKIPKIEKDRIDLSHISPVVEKEKNRSSLIDKISIFSKAYEGKAKDLFTNSSGIIKVNENVNISPIHDLIDYTSTIKTDSIGKVSESIFLIKKNNSISESEKDSHSNNSNNNINIKNIINNPSLKINDNNNCPTFTVLDSQIINDKEKNNNFNYFNFCEAFIICGASLDNPQTVIDSERFPSFCGHSMCSSFEAYKPEIIYRYPLKDSKILELNSLVKKNFFNFIRQQVYVFHTV